MSELGSMLIRAREARGLTLEDAERDTRISRRYLQALESEQFEVIPAPVYARGFLRSYSQYLGMDPKELLALFPRDDDGVQGHEQPERPSVKQPISATGPSRPAWSGRGNAPAPVTRPARPAPPAQRQQPERAPEPTIGIDIGVPAPARKIRTDPAAQARSMTVLIAALVVVVGVLLLAFVISRFAGNDDPAGGGDGGGGVAASGSATVRSASPSPSPEASGLNVTRGVVPQLIDQPAETARRAIREAGYTVNEYHQNSAKPRGTVIDQAPVAGDTLAEGSEVNIVVSDGPQ